MKRRLRRRAEPRHLVRRHRCRPSVFDTGASAEVGWVNATVFFTETSRAGETAVWLEPDVRGERARTVTQF